MAYALLYLGPMELVLNLILTSLSEGGTVITVAPSSIVTEYGL